MHAGGEAYVALQERHAQHKKGGQGMHQRSKLALRGATSRLCACSAWPKDADRYAHAQAQNAARYFLVEGSEAHGGRTRGRRP